MGLRRSPEVDGAPGEGLEHAATSIESSGTRLAQAIGRLVGGIKPDTEEAKGIVHTHAGQVAPLLKALAFIDDAGQKEGLAVKDAQEYREVMTGQAVRLLEIRLAIHEQAKALQSLTAEMVGVRDAMGLTVPQVEQARDYTATAAQTIREYVAGMGA